MADPGVDVYIDDEPINVVQAPTPIPVTEKGQPGGVATLDDMGVLSEAQRPPGSDGGGAVDSVNGQTGAVVLDAADVGAAPETDVAVIKESPLNVQYPEFAAKGDGSVDDTAAIQAALDQAAEAGGAHVYVPNGLYLLGGAGNDLVPGQNYLSPGPNTKLELAPGATIKRNSATQYMLYAGTLNPDGTNSSTGYDSGPANVEICGGTWDANKAAFPAAQVNAITGGHCEFFYAHDTTLANCTKWHFLEFHGVRHGVARNVKCRDFDAATAGKEMIQVDLGLDGTPCEDILVDGCTFVNGCRGVGSHSAAPHRKVRVIGCHFDGMREQTIAAFSWGHAVMVGNTFENCQRGIRVDAPAGGSITQIVIVGNEMSDFAGAAGPGIELDGLDTNHRVTQAVVTGNVIGGKAGMPAGITAAHVRGLKLGVNIVTGTDHDDPLLTDCLEAQTDPRILTQAEWDALADPDPATLYVVAG